MKRWPISAFLRATRRTVTRFRFRATAVGRWLFAICAVCYWCPAAAANFNKELLHNPKSYREGTRAGYAMDASYLARMYDESPEAARELASIRAGSLLVTGAVLDSITLPDGTRAAALESNRAREVGCVFKKGEPANPLVKGSIVSVTGSLVPLEPGDPDGPAHLKDCVLVWASPDVGVAAATVLWCSTDRFSPEAGKRALRKGSALLAKAGLKQPPTGCNEALMIILNDCANGVVRRECRTQWLRGVLSLLAGEPTPGRSPEPRPVPTKQADGSRELIPGALSPGQNAEPARNQR